MNTNNDAVAKSGMADATANAEGSCFAHQRVVLSFELIGFGYAGFGRVKLRI
jgi:hypothetical protein